VKGQGRDPRREGGPADGPGEPPSARQACKAYKNSDFLSGPDARVLRILAEYLEPLQRFRENRIRDTIVFFGSSRALPGGRPEGEPGAKLDRYYEEARRLAFLLTRWSKGLHNREHRFLVCSGGGPGIMEAANRGASEAGGETIGLNISIRTEQNCNPYISRSLNFEFHYFFIRKFWFVYLAKALVIFPGGFGTMDELFEILTLVQVEKVTKPLPIVLFGSEYWNDVLDLQAMVRWGTIAPEDLRLLRVFDDSEQAFQYLSGQLEEHYLSGRGGEGKR
jgi:uncharacterized protein (TIGR00730 family)